MKTFKIELTVYKSTIKSFKKREKFYKKKF